MRIKDILKKQGELYKNLTINKTLQEYNKTIKPKQVLYKDHWISKQECEAIMELKELIKREPAIAYEERGNFEIIIENNKVTYLSITGENFKEIPKQINNLTNLKELHLIGNQITEIKNLDKLVNLKDLRLYWNKITGIKGLDNLVNLKTLYLFDNQITKIKGLDNLTKLKSLFLEGNKITKIEGLDNLTNLKLLWLDNNQISKGQNKKEIKKLRKRKVKIEI